MNNQDIARLGVKIASKKLGFGEHDIELSFKPQKEFIHPEDNAIFNQDRYTITFSKEWILQATELEILKCAFHETRHAYQKACIEYPEVMIPNVNETVLSTWKIEFKQYEDANYDKYLE